MKRTLAVFALSFFCFSHSLPGQSLGNAGTIEGTVLDPSGAAVPKASITIHNAITGYHQTAASAADGSFRLVNIPPNPYHLEVQAPGFDLFTQDVDVRSAVPVSLKVTLALPGSKTSINVEAAGADMLEVDSSAHTDADRSLIVKLPVFDPAGGLAQAITYATGGVAADANGIFHPVGDHSQTSFVVDGQPISDQQSKVFSTQLPSSAIQSMEVVTGAPDAEFGDKSSLIANVTTRSGLGSGRVFGNLDATYGSFGSVGGDAAIGFGNAHAGNFLTVEGMRSGRFLDTPEFTPFHDKGNGETIFDRFDYQPNGQNVFHLNLFTARNWIQIPNDYDQLGQDQRQRVLTWSFAPGYQHTFGSHALLTINPYIRKDQFNYYPSRDPFADTPATQSQQRHLLNWGVKSDLSVTAGRNDLKFGIDMKQTRLREDFGFGITDDTFNPVCVDADGNAAGPDTLTNPDGCAKLGLTANPNFSVGLLPFDLTRGGSLLAFHATHNINQYAAYVQDSIKAGNFQIKLGLRVERYDGISTANGFEPRVGAAYHVKKTGTVLRAAYSRTLETPFNENLLLSSVTGNGGLDLNVFGGNAVPIKPGQRNQFNTGLQQALGRYLLVDADYFWKYTNNAFDYSVLLNTTLTFPIAWHNSKLDGVTGRVSSTNLKGFQAYWTFGHTRARYFPPETGGLIPPAGLLNNVFRIDHDQAFQSTGVFRYQHKNNEWVSFTWRYDSGLVVSGVPDSDAALALSPNQQATIGLSCGDKVATYTNGGLGSGDCGNSPVLSKLITLPQAGAENDDHNPDRVKPRHVFNLGLGTDNLFHTEKRQRFTASVEIANLMNKVALYNFLSTFSGTHFLSASYRRRSDRVEFLAEHRIMLQTARGDSQHRTKRTRRNAASSRRASRTVIVLAAAILTPVVVALVLIARTFTPDLFDLMPIASRSEPYQLLAWRQLERRKHALDTGGISSGTRIRALGYMMEGDRPVRDGDRVLSFILVPDAGNAVHPAHRFGDEMIDVRLDVGSEVGFSRRSLDWVWGTLQSLPGDPSGHEPLYILDHARTEPASKADIRRYFK